MPVVPPGSATVCDQGNKIWGIVVGKVGVFIIRNIRYVENALIVRSETCKEV